MVLIKNPASTQSESETRQRPLKSGLQTGLERRPISSTATLTHVPHFNSPHRNKVTQKLKVEQGNSSWWGGPVENESLAKNAWTSEGAISSGLTPLCARIVFTPRNVCSLHSNLRRLRRKLSNVPQTRPALISWSPQRRPPVRTQPESWRALQKFHWSSRHRFQGNVHSTRPTNKRVFFFPSQNVCRFARQPPRCERESTACH